MTNAIALAVLLTASWERTGDSGRLTKYGGHYDPKAMTCATSLWPANTMLRVTERHNGSFVIVRVIDIPAIRFSRTRIDLSRAAFAKLDSPVLGLADVSVTPLTKGLISPQVSGQTVSD